MSINFASMNKLPTDDDRNRNFANKSPQKKMKTLREEEEHRSEDYSYNVMDEHTTDIEEKIQGTILTKSKLISDLTNRDNFEQGRLV